PWPSVQELPGAIAVEIAVRHALARRVVGDESPERCVRDVRDHGRAGRRRDDQESRACGAPTRTVGRRADQELVDAVTVDVARCEAGAAELGPAGCPDDDVRLTGVARSLGRSDGDLVAA